MDFNFSISLGRKKNYVPQTQAQSETITTKTTDSKSVINSLFNGHIASVKMMYDEIPEISAPVDLLIDKCLDIPIVHQRKKGNDWVDVENSEFDNFLKKPNQFEKRKAFEKNILLNNILFGEVILNRYAPVGFGLKDGKSFILPAYLTSIIYDFGQDFREKNIRSVMYNGINLTEPEDYIYYRSANSVATPDHRGVSRLAKLLITGSVLKAVAESNYKIIASRGALGILHPSGDMNMLSTPDIEAIQSKYYEKTGITGDKDNLLITGKQLDYKQIGLNVRDLGLDQSQIREFRQVCRVLGIPSPIVGDMEKATYNNMGTAENMFYRNAVMPNVAVLVEIYQELFGLDERVERFYPDFSDISALQPSREMSVKLSIEQYKSGIITLNEARIADSYDEVNDGDKYYENQNDQENTSGENSQN